MTIEEKVAAYFDRELNPDEISAFENELSSNNELKREFDFQKDIIDGLQAARKAELKAMLNNVPVGGSYFTGTSQWVQYFAAAIITAMVGFGIYYFWPENNVTSENSASDIETPVENTETKVQEAESIITDQNKEEKVELPSTDSKKEEEKQITNNASPDNTVEEQQSEPTINTESIRPTPIQGIDEEESSAPDMPENNLAEKSSLGEEPIITDVISGIRKYNFHYMFESGKLMLYGDFNETYEILDFIQDGERTVYLYYSGNYYSLSLTKSEITPLEKLSDQATIKSLEQKRKSR